MPSGLHRTTPSHAVAPGAGDGRHSHGAGSRGLTLTVSIDPRIVDPLVARNALMEHAVWLLDTCRGLDPGDWEIEQPTGGAVQRALDGHEITMTARRWRHG